jgi:hypothetical protein
MGPDSAAVLGTGLAPRLGARRSFPKAREVFDDNRQDRATVDDIDACGALTDT